MPESPVQRGTRAVARAGRRRAAGPLIAVPVARQDARWGVWSRTADLLDAAYAEHVRRAGGVPLLVPPGGSDDEAETVVGAVDGLLLPGGPDVEPARYGSEPHPCAGPFRPDRDAWELALLDAASSRGLPVLGVCRGMQLINVSRGGTLHQHLPDRVGSRAHNPTVGEFGSHEVTTAPGTRLRSAVGERAAVPTYHHQAPDRVGHGLTVSAWTQDGTVEGLEADDLAWVAGVQWHPEVDDANDLFAAFVTACTTAGGTAVSRTTAPPLPDVVPDADESDHLWID